MLIEQLFSSVDKYCHLDSNLYTTVEYIPAMDTTSTTDDRNIARDPLNSLYLVDFRKGEK